jgi:hypothetical protein
MGAKIPCYFSALRMAFVAEQGSPPAPALGLFRLSEGVAGRLNPCLFKCLRFFINDSPVFPFLALRFVLTCQKAAVATFALAQLPRRQNFAFVIFLVLTWYKCY